MTLHDQKPHGSIQFVSSVSELKPNSYYQDPSTSEEWCQVDDFIIEKVSHCLSLRLLHIYGPFDHQEWGHSTLLLAVSCVHDSDHRIMVCLRVDDQPPFPSKPITLDLINCTFTLKNFLTIPTKAGLKLEQDCPFETDYNFAICASTQYNSNLKFYGEDNTTKTNNEDVNFDDNESVYSAVTSMSIEIISQNDMLITDDESDLLSLTDNISSEKKSLNIPSCSSTPKKQNTGSEIEAAAPHFVMPSTSNGLNANSRDTPSRNNSTNVSNNGFSLPPSEQEVGQINEVPEEKIQEILALIKSDLKNKFRVENFVRSNIKHVNFDDTIELTSYCQMNYPANSIQSYNQANVVGAVGSWLYRHDGSPPEIELFDNETPRFLVKLGFKPLSLVTSGPIDDAAIYKDYDKHRREYPDLRIGDIVCIRKLCLSLKSINICVHPEQLTVVNVNQKGGLMSTCPQRKLSVEEFVRVIELECFQASSLVNPEAKRSSTHRVINLAGQYLGTVPRRSPNILQIYLLLPTSKHAQSYLGDAGLLILDNVEAFDVLQRKLFTKEKIQQLIVNNYIISTTIYEKHQKIFTDRLVNPLDLVVFYNLHLKEDRYYSGYSQFIFHGGNDYGRHCAKVDSLSILGKHILNSLDRIHQELSVDNNMLSYFEDYQANLDERVLSSLGQNANQLIKNLSKNDKMLSERPPCMKMNIIKYVIPQHSMFQPYVSINSAKLVNSISDMVKDNETQLFRLPARLADYCFQDKNGNTIKDMAHLRKSLLKMLCTSSKCDFVVPFLVFLSQIGKSLVDGAELTCGKCQQRVTANLSIQLTLQDNASKRLVVFISSPETEKLIGCSNNQLIYTDPNSEDICRALQYFLKSICPNPQPMIFSNSPEEPSALGPDFTLFDWILECSIADVKNFNFDDLKNLHRSYLQNNPEAASLAEIKKFNIYRVRALCLREDSC